MRRILSLASMSLLISSLVVSSALAKGHRGDHDGVADAAANHKDDRTADTITYWCANLNEVWDVEVPVVVGRGNFLGGDPTVSPYCGDPNALTDGRFPVAVPAGSRFRPAGIVAWWTNKTYPRGYAEALRAAGLGYTFHPHSNSPAEDFLSKIVNVRVEIYSEDDLLLAEFNFDPRRTFKRIQLGELFFGQTQLGPAVDPVLGINLSATEVDRLPTFGFNVLPNAPMQSGTYYFAEYWTFSDYHWDGLGVDPNGNLFPPGEWFMAQSAFRVP